MKKLIPLLVLLAAIASMVPGLRAPAPVRDFDLNAAGRLPILMNGRIKPLDTVARTTLLQLQNRQVVYRPTASADEKQEKIVPMEWLLDLIFRPEVADTYRTFIIDNPEVLTVIGKTEEDLKIQRTGAGQVMGILGFIPTRHRRFAFNEISPHIAEIERQAKLADGVEQQLRTPFQRGILGLYHNLIAYQRIKYSFVPPDRPNFLSDLTTMQADIAKAVEAARAQQDNKSFDQAVLQNLLQAQARFQVMAETASLLIIPPEPPSQGDDWKKAGEVLLETFSSGQVNPAALTYAGLAHTWRSQNPEQFNEVVKLYRSELERRLGHRLDRGDAESRLNHFEPFYRASVLFAFGFLAAMVSWLVWTDSLSRIGYYFIGLAFLLTTLGIAARMWIEARPPVTNLYSSALFVGWGAVGLCLILERIFRNGIGSVAAGAVGFCALIIAHNLSLSGDTMEMMRAVLDSNFWLATHVVTVTIGYSATFLAGFLAVIYIIRALFARAFPKALDKPTADSLNRMVYGIVCFATLFSLVGTVLGGIWADQSWGRFWGWDPKENGALIIVLWNAVILHVRWGGLAKGSPFMALVVFGNVVTAWSWFGTNMLGVGLHSYGFMDAAFAALVIFISVQLVIMGLAFIPNREAKK